MERPVLPKLSFDEYYMNLAIAVRRRANCVGMCVGAILVKDNRVRATGYNGVPEHMTNCEEGGCERCANREQYKGGEGYDLCICVHAEQNALMVAARYGIAIICCDALACFRRPNPLPASRSAPGSSSRLALACLADSRTCGAAA